MAAYENQESLPYILEAINDLQEWIWKALRLEIPFLQKKNFGDMKNIRMFYRKSRLIEII